MAGKGRYRKHDTGPLIHPWSAAMADSIELAGSEDNVDGLSSDFVESSTRLGRVRVSIRRVVSDSLPALRLQGFMESKLEWIVAMDGEKQKTIARCDECGEIYSVQVHDDGTIHVIGNAGPCSCGSTDFTVLDPDDVGESPS